MIKEKYRDYLYIETMPEESKIASSYINVYSTIVKKQMIRNMV